MIVSFSPHMPSQVKLGWYLHTNEQGSTRNAQSVSLFASSSSLISGFTANFLGFFVGVSSLSFVAPRFLLVPFDLTDFEAAGVATSSLLACEAEPYFVLIVLCACLLYPCQYHGWKSLECHVAEQKMTYTNLPDLYRPVLSATAFQSVSLEWSMIARRKEIWSASDLGAIWWLLMRGNSQY